MDKSKGQPEGAQVASFLLANANLISGAFDIKVMASRGSALDKIYLCLIRYLNVGSIKPHLKQNKLLTDEELERLSCHQTSQSAVEALVKIIKRKGPNHELGFLSALKDSMEFDPHQGHVEVIAALEASLAMTVDREPAVEESKQGNC